MRCVNPQLVFFFSLNFITNFNWLTDCWIYKYKCLSLNMIINWLWFHLQVQNQHRWADCKPKVYRSGWGWNRSIQVCWYFIQTDICNINCAIMAELKFCIVMSWSQITILIFKYLSWDLSQLVCRSSSQYELHQSHGELGQSWLCLLFIWTGKEHWLLAWWGKMSPFLY